MEPGTPPPALPSLESDELHALAGLYRLLAGFLLRELDGELLAHLQTPDVRAAYLAAGGVLPEIDDPTQLEQLAADYCQLFIGPADHLPPYESVWRAGRFEGQAAQAMARFVEIAGGDDTFPAGVMRDHLGIQLEVMGRVLAAAADATQSRREHLELAQTFFARHLTWPARLLDRAHRQAATDVYRALTSLTAEFLASEQDVWLRA